LGVCPQFDILWNQLTAGEHLRMFAAIKIYIIFILRDYTIHKLREKWSRDSRKWSYCMCGMLKYRPLVEG